MSCCVYLVQSLNRSRPFSTMGMTPSDQCAHPADSPQTLRSRLWIAAAIACAGLAVFASGWFAPFFEDEYAYISQCYYADLFFAGRFNDRAWLDLPAIDLPPLPKYLIGLSFRLARIPMPNARAARAWYDHYGHYGTPRALRVARLPILFVGAFGCVAIFACGILIKDTRVGTVAALGLMLNPLYRLHAHRAMSDVPSEAFTLAALAFFLWWWQRVWSGRPGAATLWLPCFAGVCAGLSLLSKFSGFLGLLIIAAWTGATLIAPSVALGRKLIVGAGSLATAIVTLAVFVGMNPFMTARPAKPLPPQMQSIASQSIPQRLNLQMKHRFQVSEDQQRNFPHNAVYTFLDKTEVFAVQGFGRFGPLGPSNADSTVRFDRRQDLGAIVWAPLVFFGLITALRLGVRQYRAGEPPTALALAIWAIVAWTVVTVYLPMAWDRYFLPIQSANALLAAIAIMAIWRPIAAPVRALARRPETLVFLILIGSYSYFWHRRDWNTASRLMLTYSIVDRGTVSITGLDVETKDIAKVEGQYYSDKLPGFSLLATAPYAIAKLMLRLPSHPLNNPKAIPHWAGDYWATLGTSGLLTAGTAVLLVLWGRELGCSPRTASLVGLAYGLATPAYVYATLAYGHQPTAFALLASFFLLWKKTKVPRTDDSSKVAFAAPRHWLEARATSLRLLLAGFLAAYAAVIELQVGPVSAILGFYLLAQCLRGDRRPDALALFPTLILLTYNQLAFGSPFDAGYFHEVTSQFSKVHSADNPTGLRFPDQFWQKLCDLLWGRYRGLSFYAPILLLALPGWVVLIVRAKRDLAVVTFSVVIAVLLVNLFYPEWTGGWSTGPRLLVPLLPFAMLPVAAVLAGESRAATTAAVIAVILTLAGGILMLLFQSVGGRIPSPYTDPLVQAVWPVFSGEVPLQDWRYGERFAWNLVWLISPNTIDRLPTRWQFVQFLPLVALQVAAMFGLWAFTSDKRASRREELPRAAEQSPPATLSGPAHIDEPAFAAS
jgi:4-amino-4-deoxy-L-arabinose transferase-like glycosyltransferase